MRSVLAGLFATLAIFATPVAGQNRAELSVHQFAHSRWLPEDGAPASPTRLAQDRQGFIWIAARTGLTRFDGVRFETITDGSAAAIGLTTALLARTDGSVWAALSNGAEVGIYRNGRLRRMAVPGARADKSQIVQMQETRGGAVWLGRGQSAMPLMRYANGSWTTFGPAAGVPSDQLNSLAAGSDGSLWAQHVGSVTRLAPGGSRFETVISFPGLRGKLAEDPAGRIWLIERRGSYVIGGSGGPLPIAPSRDWLPSDTGARRGGAAFGANGDLWVATRRDGLQRLAGAGLGVASHLETITAIDGLSSDATQDVFEDRQGNVWLATTRGLDRFSRKAIVREPLLVRPAAFGDVLWAALDGSVYIGQADALYRVSPGGAPQRVMAANEPEALCEDADGAVILADADAVYRIAPDGISRRPRPARAETGLYDCAPGPDGRLWISAARGGMYAWTGQTWQSVREDLAQRGFFPNNLTRTPDGGLAVIWNNDDVGRFNRAGAYSTFMKTRSVGAFSIPLYQGASGLFVADSNGLTLWRRGQRLNLGPDRLPALARVTGLVQTPDGQTWWQAADGVSRVPTAALEAAFVDPARAIRPAVFGFDQGLPDVQAGDSWRSMVRGGDGRLWIATAAGTVWLDPSRLGPTLPAPTSLVTAIQAGGRTYPDPARIELPKGVADLRIDYTGLNLALPERVRFQYRLIGYDKGWIDAGERRQTAYTNLAPGPYRFEVRAANPDGPWSETASSDLRIQPTFLQSWIFRILCVLALLPLLWIAYRMQLARATERVRRGMEERHAERERIARELHDTILQSLQGVIVMFQAMTDRLTLPDPDRAKVHAALDQADAAMIEGRDRVRDLRLPTTTLAAALEAQIRQAGLRGGVEPELQVQGSPWQASPEGVDELAGIAREALTNAARHAHARRVWITLDYGARDLTLCIQDDGVGLGGRDPVAGRAGSFGVIGMRERAGRIGADLSIADGPGGGVRVRVLLPRRGWLLATLERAGRRAWRRMGLSRGTDGS